MNSVKSFNHEFNNEFNHEFRLKLSLVQGLKSVPPIQQNYMYSPKYEEENFNCFNFEWDWLLIYRVTQKGSAETIMTTFISL